jgi:hypothetical protein
MRNCLSGGLIRALDFGEAMPLKDRITMWCLIFAFCRWFDPGDIQALAKLRDSFLSSCSNEAERIQLSQELRKLTPSEVEREPAESRSFKRTPPSFDAPSEILLEPALAAVYDFASRLQAWIVLCKLADVKQLGRPTFPLKAESTQGSLLITQRGGVLNTGTARRGRARFVDRHPAARGKLDNLRNLGFDLSGVEETYPRHCWRLVQK